MKITIAYIVFVFAFLSFQSSSISQLKYWEELNKEEQGKILNDSATCKEAADYYNGKLKASDDSLTEKILLSAIEMKKFNPLYFYVFNAILEKSDGALAELMPDNCYNLMISFPTAILNYFTKLYLGKGGEYYRSLYANFIGEYFLLAGKNDKITKRKMLEDGFEKFKNSSKLNKKTVKLFWDEVKKASVPK